MQYVLIEPTQAHKAIQKMWLDVKNSLVAGRKQVVDVRDYDDKLSDQQRRYYHGYVLNEIAKQANVDGNKYSLATWKEHFRRLYLGDEVQTVTNPMTGAQHKEVVRVSTEGLGVKKYTLLIDHVTDFATAELGVNFYQDFDQWIEENSL